MHLAIFGGTGRTGRQLIDQALGQHHSITALARDPSRLPTGERLQPVAGDIHDAAAVDKVIAGADAVLCAVGQTLTARTAVCTDAMRVILPAMDAHQAHRLVAVSLYGAGDSHRGTFGTITRLTARPLMRDKDGMEALIRASSTDWTILRPAILRDGPHTGHYHTGTSLHLGFRSRMSFADLADAMLTHATSNSAIRQAIAITA